MSPVSVARTAILLASLTAFSWAQREETHNPGETTSAVAQDSIPGVMGWQRLSMLAFTAGVHYSQSGDYYRKTYTGALVSSVIGHYAIGLYGEPIYARLGLGASINEGFWTAKLPDATIVTSWFPVYLYFVPHISIRKGAVQPGRIAKRTPSEVVYEYNPAETEYVLEARTFTYLYAGGSLWADPEWGHVFGKGQHINVGFGIDWQFRLTSKPLIMAQFMTLGLRGGVAAVRRADAKTASVLTHIEVALGLGSSQMMLTGGTP